MRKPTGIRFTDDEYEAITSYAQAENMSISDVVRNAVRSYISPDYGHKYLSLHQLSLGQGGDDLTLAFGQFLDDFSNAKDKTSLIADEPSWTLEKAGRWFFDFAATAHKLADDNNMPVPQWCLQQKYFSQKPYYAFETEDPDFRKYLEDNTPREFVWHGLFLGPNVMQRM